MIRLLVTVLAGLLAPLVAFAGELPPIVSEGVVDAPPAEVWRAWTTAEGLRSWLAPLADIDLRLDGLMRANYNPQGTLGDEGTIENRVLAFEPERMLAIKVDRPPKSFPFQNAVRTMWTVIYFVGEGGNRTLVRAVSLGFTDDPESAGMRDFFQKGNDATLAALRNRFATGSKAHP